jgi:hypothetical protein
MAHSADKQGRGKRENDTNFEGAKERDTRAQLRRLASEAAHGEGHLPSRQPTIAPV